MNEDWKRELSSVVERLKADLQLEMVSIKLQHVQRPHHLYALCPRRANMRASCITWKLKVSLLHLIYALT